MEQDQIRTLTEEVASRSAPLFHDDNREVVSRLCTHLGYVSESDASCLGHIKATTSVERDPLELFKVHLILRMVLLSDFPLEMMVIQECSPLVLEGLLEVT